MFSKFFVYKNKKLWKHLHKKKKKKKKKKNEKNVKMNVQRKQFTNFSA